ncbi:hypothetical protein BDF19DRAFT_167097 [Syncephalis fuscata]|nr:hypothetical protein BDF19DRAFT_167097 [Syncephalis fuscata]
MICNLRLIIATCCLLIAKSLVQSNVLLFVFASSRCAMRQKIYPSTTIISISIMRMSGLLTSIRLSGWAGGGQHARWPSHLSRCISAFDHCS